MQKPPALLRVHGDPTVAIDPLAVGRIVEEIFPEALGVWIYGSSPTAAPAATATSTSLFSRTDPLISGSASSGRSTWVRGSAATWILVDLRNVSPVLRFEVVTRGMRVAARDPYAADVMETAAIPMFQRLNESQGQHLARVEARALAP